MIRTLFAAGALALTLSTLGGVSAATPAAAQDVIIRPDGNRHDRFRHDSVRDDGFRRDDGRRFGRFHRRPAFCRIVVRERLTRHGRVVTRERVCRGD